jgi:hypothetical protein
MRLNDPRLKCLQIETSTSLSTVATKKTTICILRQLRSYLNGSLENAPGHLISSPGREYLKTFGMFPNGTDLPVTPRTVFMNADSASSAPVDTFYVFF